MTEPVPCSGSVARCTPRHFATHGVTTAVCPVGLVQACGGRRADGAGLRWSAASGRLRRVGRTPIPPKSKPRHPVSAPYWRTSLPRRVPFERTYAMTVDDLRSFARDLEEECGLSTELLVGTVPTRDDLPGGKPRYFIHAYGPPDGPGESRIEILRISGRVRAPFEFAWLSGDDLSYHGCWPAVDESEEVDQ